MAAASQLTTDCMAITGAAYLSGVGDNDAVPTDTLDLDRDGSTSEPLPLDLDGADRFADDPDRADAGHGVVPIVDIGAYELTPAPIVPPTQPLSNLSVRINFKADSGMDRDGQNWTYRVLMQNQISSL